MFASCYEFNARDKVQQGALSFGDPLAMNELFALSGAHFRRRIVRRNSVAWRGRGQRGESFSAINGIVNAAISNVDPLAEAGSSRKKAFSFSFFARSSRSFALDRDQMLRCDSSYNAGLNRYLR